MKQIDERILDGRWAVMKRLKPLKIKKLRNPLE
jgi:hypothetical protein